MIRKGDEPVFEEVGDGDKFEHEQGCVESTQQACLCYVVGKWNTYVTVV